MRAAAGIQSNYGGKNVKCGPQKVNESITVLSADIFADIF